MPQIAFKPGSDVEVCWPYMEEWYPAKVVSGEIGATGLATYTVEYADGTSEGTRHVKERNIRCVVLHLAFTHSRWCVQVATEPS